MDKIAIYGAGGFGREIACLINSINLRSGNWDLIGFIDDGLPGGTANNFGKVVGGIDFLNSVNYKLAVVISISDPAILNQLVISIKNPNVWFPNLMAPDASFHDFSSCSIGIGNILFFSCRISCNVQIGNFNILNSLVSLGHDVRLGDYNVLNPAVRISGESIIGNCNYFGLHSIVLQQLRVGNNTRVGVSSVIMRNTLDGHTYFGNPAKRIRIR